MRPLVSCALIVCALLVVSPRAAAQIPDEFTNLEVLPKDIAKAELVATMRSFAGALGVRCTYCHVGPDNLQGMDFATDELPTKKTARHMLRMVAVINQNHIASLETEREAKLRVECITCHRGVPLPMRVDDLLERTIKAQGVDAAIRRYTDLRDAFYGRSSYDFGPQPLNDLAERLHRGGDSDAAIELTYLNNELHPDYVWSRILLAGIHKSRSENAEAIAAYQEALKIEPDNGFAKKQLEELMREE